MMPTVARATSACLSCRRWILRKRLLALLSRAVSRNSVFRNVQIRVLLPHVKWRGCSVTVGVPAMEDLTDHVWSLDEIVTLIVKFMHEFEIG